MTRVRVSLFRDAGESDFHVRGAWVLVRNVQSLTLQSVPTCDCKIFQFSGQLFPMPPNAPPTHQRTLAYTTNMSSTRSFLRFQVACGSVEGVRQHLAHALDMEEANAGLVDAVEFATSAGVLPRLDQPHIIKSDPRRIQIVRDLLNAGCNVNARVGGVTPLLNAVCGRSPSMIKLLLRAGASVAHNKGILAAAVSSRRACIVQLLIDAGVSREHMELAAMHAMHLGAVGMLRLLIRNGLDVNFTTLDADTLLHVATQRRRTDAVRLLVAAGALANVSNSRGRTALHNAARVRMTVCVPILLDAGANLRAADLTARTAIKTAAERRFHGTVRALLEAGAHEEEPTAFHVPLHIERTHLTAEEWLCNDV